MNNTLGYNGIDRFRIVAAFLVVAIHTSPLLSVSLFSNYLFAQVLARVAVPFFLATTGFFLFGAYEKEVFSPHSRIITSIKKMAIIYVISIIIYIPVNIYSGHFNDILTFGDAVKMVLVDGTTYHLWYLPASIFGTILVWILLRYTGLKIATVIAIVLYIVGLLGDSYYGIAASSSSLEGIYQWIFNWCDYTRNGLFYAPIFLLMGVWASKRTEITRIKSGVFLCISLVLMIIEGIILYNTDLQKHDSMYVLLPLCILFLMIWLSSFRGKSSKKLRDTSLIIYIIHIWIVVLLRGAAKVLKIDAWVVDNTVINFILVSIFSLIAAYILLRLYKLIKPKKNEPHFKKRAWIEIDFKALEHNVTVLKNIVPADCRLMPAIKANAYGLGVIPIAQALYKMDVTDYCVASLSEGIELRKNGVKGSILILGYTHPNDCHLIKRYRLMQTVVDYEHGVQLAGKNISIDVHIKIDSGMRRLGELSENIDEIAKLFSFNTLNICGIFTQLSCSDSNKPDDISRSKKQIETYYLLMEQLKSKGIVLPKTHIQCSYGIINYPEINADYARPGLALYGIVDEEYCIEKAPDLIPIFTIKARIGLVKNVKQDEYVGYGTNYKAERNMQIAIITMGYADGLPRNMSKGVGSVLINGKRAPIVGNICMDQAIVDVSHIPDIVAGEDCIIIGKQSNDAEISINEFSSLAGTIPNEIVSRLGERLERYFSE